MPNRALIVAIEHYPKSGDLAQHLDHVNERATDCYAWAIDKTKKKIEPPADKLDFNYIWTTWRRARRS